MNNFKKQLIKLILKTKKPMITIEITKFQTYNFYCYNREEILKVTSNKENFKDTLNVCCNKLNEMTGNKPIAIKVNRV